MRVLCWFRLAAAALAFAGGAASAAQAPTPRSAPAEPALAFTSVNVLPMTAGEPLLRRQTVLVEKGRIIAVGPAASVRIPRHAVRIDGRSKYLMPGLADMHVHLELLGHPAYLKLFLVHGVTLVRSMDGRPNILDWRRQAASGMLASPDIITAGRVLDGRPGRRPVHLELATAEAARRAVEQQAAAGYDFIKVYNNLGREAFEAVMQAAAARNLPVVGHVPTAVPLDLFLHSGVRSIEHLSDFADAIAVPPPPGSEPPGHIRRRLGFAASEARMAALAARVAASRVWVVPTMITEDRLVATVGSVDRWASDPAARTTDRGLLGWWRRTVLQAAGGVGAAHWQWVERGRANRLALVRAFRRAGVPLLVGSDTPSPFVFPGASVHDELANFVAAGMAPGEALAAATREPARFLGRERMSGTVEPGKRADLLLLDANPLADIDATRRIAGVVSGGRWLPAATLQRMRQEVEQVAATSS